MTHRLIRGVSCVLQMGGGAVEKRTDGVDGADAAGGELTCAPAV